MKKQYLAALAAITCVATPPAMAWSASPGPEKALELDKLTVTANKIEEKIEDIPQSVSVLDEETLENKRIYNVGDIIKEVPNLSSTFLYSEDVNFRGLNSSTFTNNNPVVLYVDGIPQSNRLGYDVSLVNVERVEVLRGPQGTLYGKDAIGGVINVVTREATNSIDGSVGAEYGSDNTMLGTFALNGPVIKDKLFFSLGGKYASSDGWVTNHSPGMDEDANSSDESKFRGNLHYKPTDRFSAKLTLLHDYKKNNGVSGLLVPYGESIDNTTRDDAENTRFERETYTKSASDAQALELRYALDSMVLTSLTTNKKISLDGDYDLDWGNNPLYDNFYQFQHGTIETQSQELRLASKQTTGFRWVGGVYLEHDVYSNDRYGMQYPGFMAGTPFDVDMDDVSETTSDTMAAFGQVMVPFLEKFELTLGARYQSIDKEFDSDFYYNPIGMSGPPINSIHGEETWSAFLPKVGLSYKVNSNLTTYASVASGYLPGGFNYWAMSGSAEDNKFNEQTSVNYEVGIKSHSGRLYLAANIFYMDIEDIHVYDFDLNTGMIRASNAGKAHSQGAEAEFSYLLGRSWELSGAVGLVQAEYDEYASTGYGGNDIERTPEYTARLGVQYTNPAGYYGRVDVRTQGSVYFNPANTLEQDAYIVTDLKAGYRFSQWDIYAFVRNLTDEEYLTSAAEQTTGTLLTYGTPMTFGIGARFNF